MVRGSRRWSVQLPVVMIRSNFNLFSMLLDARVRDYPLMQSPIQMTLILLSYILLVLYVGPRYMTNRKPYHLKTPMVIYNFCMVFYNAYIVYEVRTGACFHFTL